jgi:hypothetical protein
MPTIVEVMNAGEFVHEGVQCLRKLICDTSVLEVVKRVKETMVDTHEAADETEEGKIWQP